MPFIPSAAQISSPVSISDLVTPMGMAIPLFVTVAALSQDNAYFARVTIPKTGNLRDLSVYVGTVNGNYSVSVYDTGDASAGNYTKLWDSGVVAVAAGADVYKIVGDPNLPVTVGQQLMLGYSPSNATLTAARLNLPTNGASGPLPAGFMVAAGGASPKMSGKGANLSPSGTWLSSITEAAMAAINIVPLVFGRMA